VTGDDLDTQVFGHRHPFRDLKRRWVFEIAYGLYDEALANLSADLRRVDLAIRASEIEAEVIRGFLAGTTLGKPDELEAQLAAQEARLAELRERAGQFRAASDSEPGGEISRMRSAVLDARQSLDAVRAEIRQHQAQLRGLADLQRQLSSLSKRLTRSIVADEWMVDFDFVVCPRCGQDVDTHRAESPICYLCEQPEPMTAPNRDSLIREQDRVTYQLAETGQLIGDREDTLAQLRQRESEVTMSLATASANLDLLTREFVSAQASQLQSLASETATVEANVEWSKRYLTLIDRQADQSGYLAALKDRKLELEEEIESHGTSVAAADENIDALEKRMLDYLTRLHVPQLGDLLTVKINRTTYLPEVSGRTFDELSSQGLKTLVNVAHALATTPSRSTAASTCRGCSSSMACPPTLARKGSRGTGSSICTSSSERLRKSMANACS
jgi:DNA repair exonuclease SbcCD ATPase subunit